VNERPDLLERFSRLGAPSVIRHEIAGHNELHNVDFAAVIAMVEKPLHKILLSAAVADVKEREQFREILRRRSWNLWRERGRAGSITLELSNRVAAGVFEEWLVPLERRVLAESTLAKAMKVDYRRWRDQIGPHYHNLLRWADAETAEALRAAARKLRRQT
jgi:hypothetical protein